MLVCEGKTIYNVLPCYPRQLWSPNQVEHYLKLVLRVHEQEEVSEMSLLERYLPHFHGQYIFQLYLCQAEELSDLSVTAELSDMPDLYHSSLQVFREFLRHI